jgi:gluconokinase
MPDAALALSLDIGTSSTRALVWDPSGREIEGVHARVQYRMETTPDGGVEMAADDFVAHVAECLDGALQQARDRAAAIRLVGISSYWHSLLGLDAQNRPVTAVYSWADTRAGEAARRVRSLWDETAVHARTGCMIHPSYWPAKITWLRETRPDLFARTARWASPVEYLLGQLFGPREERVSISMASGTGLFDQARCAWDTVTLGALGIDAGSLAPIVDESQPARGLRDPFAKRWPALRDVPFYPAVGDGACGNIGSGCVNPSRMAINVGTSGAIRVVWDEKAGQQAPAGPTTADQQPATDPLSSAAHPPPLATSHQSQATSHQSQATSLHSPAAVPPGLWRYRVDGRRPIVGAAFSDGGNVFAWMNGVLKLPPQEALERELAAREPGAAGLVFLPFLAGERSVGWNPDARAALTGLDLNTGPVDILATALEAVAVRFALAMDLLEGLFPSADEIVASGAALAHSPAWAQMFADALGTPVRLAAEPEASSRGAALLAMEAAGVIPGVETAEAQLGATYLPDPRRRERYKEMLSQQQELYRRLH